MIVPYRAFFVDKKLVHRPLIQVKLKYRARSFSTWGLLDSGADKFLINKEIAKQLGIDLNPLPRKGTQGIVGLPVPTWETSIDIEVEGFNDTFHSKISILDSHNVGILLGHTGFFEFFDVKLQTAQKQFEIELAKN